MSAARGDDLSTRRQGYRVLLRRGDILIELQVAGNDHRVRPRPDLPYPRGVRLGLHAEQIDVRKDLLEKYPEFQIIFVRVRRYPAIDDCRGDAAFFQVPEEIGPEFRFGNEHDDRIDAVDDPAHDPGVIERKVEDRVRFRHPLARREIAGDRHGGKDQAPARIFLFQLPDHRVRGHDLSHGHRVHPDRPGTPDHLLHALAHTAELLRNAPPVFRDRDELEQNDRQQKDCREDKQYAVNDIHGITFGPRQPCYLSAWGIAYL